MFNLGVLLAHSDPGKARHWYEKAAEAGHVSLDPDLLSAMWCQPSQLTTVSPCFAAMAATG
jgi:TPR repeat protein